MHIESFSRPRQLEEALRLLKENPELTPIAGGTDLVVQIRGRRRNDQHLMDLSRILPREIKAESGTLSIGAAATMDSIARSDTVRSLCPALAEAASRVGAWPIQCRATLGGNLANASPAADTAPPLLTADAVLILQSLQGTRRVPLDSFFSGPGASILKAGELIVSVEIDRHELPTLSFFKKLGWRQEQIISVISLAMEIHIDDEGLIRKAGVAFGAVAATPKRAHRVERCLSGRRLDEETIREAVEVVQADIAPIDDFRAPAWYRRIAGAVMLRRALEGASGD